LRGYIVEFGALEARNKLGMLLDRVGLGEEIVIILRRKEL